MRTAPDNGEEGGDEVKSAWPLCPGLHTCYNARHKALQTREGELIAKKRAQFGLQSATRLHEAGIASNGASERRREYVPGLVHTARHITKVGCTRNRRANRKGAGAQGMIHNW